MLQRNIANRPIIQALFTVYSITPISSQICDIPIAITLLYFAIELFKQSAEGGFAKAQMRLSSMYYNGEIVPEDLGAAYHWGVKAANQGEAEAQYMVGALLATGERDPTKLMKAVRWFKLAAAQGDAPAQNYLGLILMGAEDTLLEGMMWLSLASQQGDKEAIEYWNTFTPKMPEQDLVKIREMARNCQARNYQGC